MSTLVSDVISSVADFAVTSRRGAVALMGVSTTWRDGVKSADSLWNRLSQQVWGRAVNAGGFTTCARLSSKCLRYTPLASRRLHAITLPGEGESDSADRIVLAEDCEWTGTGSLRDPSSGKTIPMDRIVLCHADAREWITEEAPRQFLSVAIFTHNMDHVRKTISKLKAMPPEFQPNRLSSDGGFFRYSSSFECIAVYCDRNLGDDDDDERPSFPLGVISVFQADKKDKWASLPTASVGYYQHPELSPANADCMEDGAVAEQAGGDPAKFAETLRHCFESHWLELNGPVYDSDPDNPTWRSSVPSSRLLREDSEGPPSMDCTTSSEGSVGLFGGRSSDDDDDDDDE